MRRNLYLCFVLISVCSIHAAAQKTFRVIEQETRAYINADKSRAEIVIDNASGNFKANLKAEIIDTDDKVLASREQSVEIASGKQKFPVPFDLLKGKSNSSYALWYRLRYSIVPDVSSDKQAVSGVISLSEIMPDIFEIKAISSGFLVAGETWRTRIHAFHPITNKPLGGVKVKGEIELDLDAKGDNDQDEVTLTAQARTNGQGQAIIEFKIPENLADDYSVDLDLEAERNGVVRKIEDDVNLTPSREWAYLNADKPIYQPGQSFNVRALLLAEKPGSSYKTRPEQELEFTIEDEDDTVLYRETVKTSRFGIGGISWKIPENAKLGTYKVNVDDDGEDVGRLEFKVSRYELPNFTVNIKPDKTYYLPHQNVAEVTVNAEYLFGKPVAKGKVKVVRENERKWSYSLQKWNIDEGEIVEGETDKGGNFIAKLDLSEQLEELKERGYSRFKDVSFAAYFTDLTTNKTEQRRFDIRLTKEVIHVYLIDLERYNQNSKLPVNFYVSTFYADGTPASCDVEIRGKYERESDSSAKTLAQVKTNRFGGARVQFMAPPRTTTLYDDLQLKVVASDSQNRTGSESEDTKVDDNKKQIQISTKKAIYRPGESIDLNLLSSESVANLYIDVVKNTSVLFSGQTKIKNGKASFRIPHREDMTGELTISAYFNDEDNGLVKHSLGVIYPSPYGFDLSVKAEKETYRPNEEAKVKFNVASFDPRQKESALGVVVFDKAIEERARTEAEFGGSRNLFGNFNSLLGSRNFGPVTLRDINEMDIAKDITGDVQLAAEIILSENDYSPSVEDSDYYGVSQFETFKTYFHGQTVTVRDYLDARQRKDFTHPVNEAQLIEMLSKKGIDFAAMRDPWGVPYQTEFRTEGEYDVLYIRSSGANKAVGNEDDFVVLSMRFKYFDPIGYVINRASGSYNKETGKFIHNYELLESEMKQQNVDLGALRDRWGNPYRFEFDVDGRRHLTTVKSNGPNGKHDSTYVDDFTIWHYGIDYFYENETRIQNVLSNYATEKKTFPANPEEFKKILSDGGIDFASVTDGWGRVPYIEVTTYSRYADKVKVETMTKYKDTPVNKTTLTPVTQQVATFYLRSNGRDGINGSYDDFELASFTGVLAEQTKDDVTPKQVKTEVVFGGGKGAITGTITDAIGAVIPGTLVKATSESQNLSFDATSNDEGVYLIKNLPSGKYTLEAKANGFKTYRVVNVPVNSSSITEINLSLSAAGVSATVEVTVSAESTVNSTSSQIESLAVNSRSFSSLLLVTKSGTAKKDGKQPVTVIEQNDTPRLREYFPETLLWQPELLTDKNGKAELKFKLGDNITTWKIYTIASNLKGKIGISQNEIKAFQPFFADLDPPKVLTVGDEISLPVQIRNYSEQKQNVKVSMAPGDWFGFLGEANQKIDVEANATSNAIFNFRANQIVKAGKQRVTAIADKDSDAIEKPVMVRPDGEEITASHSEIFRDNARFEVNFPQNALSNTQKAELKIYPNLMAHVAESIEGILSRPYGCGEQTVSSTYPNVMLLKYKKSTSAMNEKLAQQAQKYLQQGYERLLGYQTADGGFAYWSRENADVALTAYAMRFLIDASSEIDVDEDVISRAQRWLISKQRADGSWGKTYNWEKTEDFNRTKMITTYVTRALAMAEKPKKEKSKEIQAALKKALDYLKLRNEEIDEPYALANLAIALLDSGDADAAKAVNAKLRKLAIAEGNAVYWNLETNTPFYGWGRAGRIETTALAVNALLRETDENANKDLTARGTMFLLKNKDRYGVWYSTQATINVLDAILTSVGNSAGNEVGQQKAEVFVNGEKQQEISLPSSNALGYPLTASINVKPNFANKVELKINGNSSTMMAQVVQEHYIKWQDSEATGRNVNQSRAIRLDFKCDKQTAKPLDEVTCSVDAERIGFKGYGMLLAEIGLPPGAEVDRASLEKAKEDNWAFSRYDVLPDKILVYMWAQAGGTKFNFKFKPRYGINAQTPASIVYDYYNPDAKAVVAPVRFVVR